MKKPAITLDPSPTTLPIQMLDEHLPERASSPMVGYCSLSVSSHLMLLLMLTGHEECPAIEVMIDRIKSSQTIWHGCHLPILSY